MRKIMEKKKVINLKDFIDLIKNSGYEIENVDIQYNSTYNVPCFIELKLISAEYIDIVINDPQISDFSKRKYLKDNNI
jgi:DNA-binding sugar fermentation-stimulating protein